MVKILIDILSLTRSSFKSFGILFVFRVIFWKINKILIKLPMIMALTEDIKCICYPSSSFGSLVVYTRLPEYWEMNFLLDNLNELSTFIDVGANIGVYTLLAASKIKKGKIFSFEIDPRALKNLYENIRLNDLGNRVEVIEKVVSDKNGYESFVFSKESEVSHILTDEKENKNISKIASIKLDDFIDSRKIRFVDFLKIDVEGAEYKVLKGLSKTLKGKRVGMILFELNSNLTRYGAGSNDVFNLLSGFGYKVYSFLNNGKIRRIKNVEDFPSNKTQNFLAKVS
ncbi:MAG: hypothetical protein KatS3mg088_467 [Patescibacteria group bacterium]|nr:MAG: hypothetical protein KatS3mg088_467 [Patescibacteria group bacterium]